MNKNYEKSHDINCEGGLEFLWEHQIKNVLHYKTKKVLWTLDVSRKVKKGVIYHGE